MTQGMSVNKSPVFLRLTRIPAELVQWLGQERDRSSYETVSGLVCKFLTRPVYYARSSSNDDEDEDEDGEDEDDDEQDDHDDHDGTDESFDVEEASENNREAEVKTRLLWLSGRGLAGGLGRGCLGPAP